MQFQKRKKKKTNIRNRGDFYSVRVTVSKLYRGLIVRWISRFLHIQFTDLASTDRDPRQRGSSIDSKLIIVHRVFDSTNTRVAVPLTGPAISGDRYNAVRIVDRHVEMQLIIYWGDKLGATECDLITERPPSFRFFFLSLSLSSFLLSPLFYAWCVVTRP